MATKRKVISSIVILVCAVLVGLFTWKVISINLKYPAPTTKVYEIGQTANYKDEFELTVVDFKFLSDDAANELFGDGSESLINENKFAITTLKIKNISNETQSIPSTIFVFQAGMFFNGAMWGDIGRINDWDKAPELKPNEETTIKVPFNVVKSRFLDSQWEKVTERKFSMVINLYPEKQVLKLN